MLEPTGIQCSNGTIQVSNELYTKGIYWANILAGAQQGMRE